MRHEVRIAGFGGQGVISIGVLLARAAGQFGGLEVAQSQSYGPEARGGACKTEVVLSDNVIDYIKPLDLGLLVAMSQPALNAYVVDIKDDCPVLVDSTMVSDLPSRLTKVFRIPATELAEKDMGQKVVANVIILGALAKLSGWVPQDACKAALKATFPPKILDKNYAAFDLGYNHAFSDTRS